VTETTRDTTVIEQTLRIAASPETLWSLWTDPQRLCEWWGTEADVVAEPGGLFRVVMENGSVMRGAFVDLDPPSRLVFSFGWEHNAPGEALAPGSTRVEVMLEPDDGETILVLRHSDVPTTHSSDHEKGWAHFVGERLVAAATAAG